MAGLVLVYYANRVPKALMPLAALKDPARRDALQRFVAWCLVLGGLGHALAWILVPFAYAAPVAVALLASSLLIAAARCFRARRIP